MNAFRDRTFTERYSKMGDTAEKKFEEVYSKGFVRWGLDRPPLQVPKLPKRIRYTPDYLTTSHLIECQGFGRDQELRLKVDKLNALEWWSLVHPVQIFVWDSHNKRYAYVDLEQIDGWINAQQVKLKWFAEGKAYWAIPAEAIFAEAAP